MTTSSSKSRKKKRVKSGVKPRGKNTRRKKLHKRNKNTHRRRYKKRLTHRNKNKKTKNKKTKNKHQIKGRDCKSCFVYRGDMKKGGSDSDQPLKKKERMFLIIDSMFDFMAYCDNHRYKDKDGNRGRWKGTRNPFTYYPLDVGNSTPFPSQSWGCLGDNDSWDKYLIADEEDPKSVRKSRITLYDIVEAYSTEYNNQSSLCGIKKIKGIDEITPDDKDIIKVANINWASERIPQDVFIQDCHIKDDLKNNVRNYLEEGEELDAEEAAAEADLIRVTLSHDKSSNADEEKIKNIEANLSTYCQQFQQIYNRTPPSKIEWDMDNFDNEGLPNDDFIRLIITKFEIKNGLSVKQIFGDSSKDISMQHLKTENILENFKEIVKVYQSNLVQKNQNKLNDITEEELLPLWYDSDGDVLKIITDKIEPSSKLINQNSPADKAADKADALSIYLEYTPNNFKKAYSIYADTINKGKILDFQNRIPNNGPNHYLLAVALPDVLRNQKWVKRTPGRQEDSHEAFTNWNNDQVIHNLRQSLNIIIKKTTKCDGKVDIKIKRESVSLNLIHDSSVSKLINSKTNFDFQEFAAGDIESCAKSVQWWENYYCHINQKILYVQLKRFTFGSTDKITTPIDINNITLTCYPEITENLTFVPVAYVIHIGKSIASGHYIAALRTKEGTWYEMNDSNVRTIRNLKYFTGGENTPYLVFYAKEELVRDDLFKKDYYNGLVNNGNTCFFNALLQCLFHIKYFNDIK